MSNVVIKGKAVLKDAGNPKIMSLEAGKPDGKREILLGSVIGVADGIKIGKNPDQLSEWKGLSGNFEITPSNSEFPTVQSGVLLLGDSFQAPIVAALEEGAKSVSFAYEIYVVAATNPQGYSWALKPLIQPEPENDPLDALRALLPAKAVPAIAAPVETTSAKK